MTRSLAGAGLALVVVGCAHSPSGHYTTTRTRSALGTTATITAVGPDEARTIGAIEASFAEVVRLEGLLSTYDPTTPLGRLNRDGRIDDAPPEALAVLERSRYYAELSGGAFDITMAPLLDLYRQTFLEAGRPPSSQEIARARELVDSEAVTISGRRVVFSRPGMRVSVDAIGKGFIIDRSVETLREAGIDSALVEIGGEVRALGRPPDRPHWRVAIRHPRRAPPDFVAAVALSDRAIATSGDYEHYFTENRQAHHLIDPRTGVSAVAVTSVSVVADSAMDADALATTTFILGPVDGLALLESIAGVEGLMMTPDGDLVSTAGWEGLVAAEP